MEQIMLNNSDFGFSLVFSKSVNEHYELHYNQIGQLVFSADLYGGASILNFTYIENYESSFFKGAVDNGACTITLQLYHQLEGYQPITVVYVVDEIRLTKNEVSTQYWAIKAVGIQMQGLESYVNYYTSELDFKNLIKNLQTRSKLKYQIDTQQISGACKKKFEFISMANETIGSQIERIMDMASSDNVCYFLGYNFFLGKYTVIEINEETDKKKKVLLKTIPTSMFNENRTPQSFTSVSKLEGLSASMSYKEYCNLYSNKFDPKNRKWERLKISDVDVISKSIIPAKSDYEFIYKEQNQQQNEAFMFLDRYTTDDNLEIGRRNRFLMLHGQRLEATLLGDVQIELGNMINITNNFQSNLGGAWMVSSVNHWLEKEKFTTTVILSRGYRIKPEKVEMN